jgi:hypothetical protein
MRVVETLRRLGACKEAREWVVDQGDASGYALWRRCDRADWLVWLAARVGLRREVVEALCDLVEPMLADVPPGEERPRIAIETARRRVRGERTARETRAAATAAYAAADEAAYAAADDAAYAAYAAAATAYAAADDARVAATYATYAAAAAAYAAAADAARVVRRRIPWRLIRDALAAEALR